MGEGFDPKHFDTLFSATDRHFWYRARNRVVKELVGQITLNLPPGYRVLEVGCGTGNVLRVIERTCVRGLVIGMDLFAESLQFARRRASCPLVQGDVYRPPFGPGFDLIGAFDVLEHLDDDVGVLHNLRTLLAPSGTLLLTVPAHQALWSYCDVAMHHCRRYEFAQLRNRLTGAGYQIEYLTYFMMGTLPLIWLGRRMAALIDRRPKTSVDRARGLATRELRTIFGLNTLMEALLAPEVRLISRRRALPNGSSLLAVCRRG